MKFNLPRQVLSKEIRIIVSREMRKQRLVFPKVTRKEAKQLASVSTVIEKRELPEGLVRKKLLNDLGFGIFLQPDAAPIEKGQVIASYAGEISLIRQHAIDDGTYAFTPVERIQLSRQEQRHFDQKGPYIHKRLYSFKVDGKKKGNFTRFINHSVRPNVIAYTLAVPSNLYGLVPSPVEVIYFAKKRILPGEQLLVCYEDGEKCYWTRGGVKPFPMTPTTFRLIQKRGRLLYHSQKIKT